MPTITMTAGARPDTTAEQRKLEQLLNSLIQGTSRPMPVEASADPRIRVLESADHSQAVILFEIAGESDDSDTAYIVCGVHAPEEALAAARDSVLHINPVNGVAEVLHETRITASAAPAPSPDTDTQPAAKRSAAETGPHRYSGARIAADGHTPESLYRELGLNRKLSEQVLATTTSMMFLRSLDKAPAWQSAAFRELASGYSVDEVREDLRLQSAEDRTPDPTASEQEKVLAAINQPAAQLEFTYIGDTVDALRDVIESGDFGRWKVFLHPQQRNLATRWLSGSGRVFGGAGTGKTVVAVHRAVNIHKGLLTGRKSGKTGTRILLTTYTRGLAASLRSMVTALDPGALAEDPGDEGIVVTGIDSLARSIVADASPRARAEATENVLGRSLLVAPRCVSAQKEAEELEAAVSATGVTLPGTKGHGAFLRQELTDVVLPGRITSKRDYLRVPRTGRGVALNRAERIAVWTVLDSYLASCAQSAKVGWETMAAIAAAVLDERAVDGDPSSRLADHVIIDEAQDFHAGHWLLIRALVARGPNDIFISEDAHQRIYGNPMVLSRFGINTRGKASAGLRLNYRTTAENLDFAVNILTGEHFVNSEGDRDTVTGYHSERSGPEPVVRKCRSFAHEMDTAAEAIRKWRETEGPTRAVRIAVLTRTRNDAGRIVDALARRDIEAKFCKEANEVDERVVSVMTMHGAKGLEFTHVIVAGVSQDQIPQMYSFARLDDEAREEAMRRERSLLYVAASRARDELLVTTSGAPSEFLRSRIGS
ncbi:AAA family ATPase [Corynebacterium sp. P6129]|uniref:3'-5' exonuclease n=1 Tax=Corynebacterium antarcticum TaxID=2800405 RepID=UPI002260B816|nr:3'-5' exonuclease [Corynebacterium antarcticum]MCX7492940.1 AAA family ATPase [Corynebacterium antarcticum]